MRPRIATTESVCPSARPPVRPSARLSVGHAFLKNNVNQYIQANNCQWSTRLTRCSLASLYDGQSIHPSVSPLICPSRFREYISTIQSKRKSRRVTSHHLNHFIIMRTHRWPYGPCSSFERGSISDFKCRG